MRYILSPDTSVTAPCGVWGYTVAVLFLLLNPVPSSRPWECGNPEGISKECGKGGKPALWLFTLSTLCHFQGLFWVPARLRFVRCFIASLVRNDDISFM